MGKVTELVTREYFGCAVTAYTTEDTLKRYPAFPWRFSVVGPDGDKHDFCGIPNYVETRAKALRRAWYRAKWLSSGTYHDHYKTIAVIPRREDAKR